MPANCLRAAILGGLLCACSEALYPPRPAQVPGPPIADPPSSRMVLHLALTREGLLGLLEAAIPKDGEGRFTMVGERRYAWQRGPIELGFDGAAGKLTVRAEVKGRAELPMTSMSFSISLSAEAQPVISSDYKAQLQAVTVALESPERLLRAAEWGAGLLTGLRGAVEAKLRELRVDLRPLLEKTYASLSQPIPFKIGEASACVSLGISGVEAGPTILSGGLEKDLAVVLSPSVTLPCTAPPPGIAGKSGLPPLHNVSHVPSGPFEVTVPLAASYDELTRAMKQAFSEGRLFFSKEHPELYLSDPEVYASGGQIVTKLHLAGFVRKGFRMHLEGDLYLTGHPEVRDNELLVPDMQPTIETKSALLALKTRLDAEAIRREVRQALRLDISSRLLPLRERLSRELSISQRLMEQGPPLCLRAEVGRVEVGGVYAHDSYLRLYVKISARSAAYLPCPPG